MSIDQISLCEHEKFKEIQEECIPAIGNRFSPGIFHTNKGYRGGYILSQNKEKNKILFVRNEYGDIIYEIDDIPIKSHIHPVRKNKNKVWIYTNSDVKFEEYIIASAPIDIGFGLGSGVSSVSNVFSKGLKKYPIHKPLTLHNIHHRNALIYASAMILQLVNEYIHYVKFSDDLLEQACWLINVVIVIDNHQIISKELFREALTNFCLDYMLLSPGTLIRQPINYIFDILNVDGVYYQKGLSISYAKTNLMF